MPTITLTRNYSDGATLTEQQLDDIIDSLETALNTTKLDSSNIQSGGISEANLGSAVVSATKIATDAVITAKIQDTAVTLAKLAATVQAALVPAGAVVAYGGTSAPTGFLMCDGTAVSRATYSALFTAIGTAHGTGDGSTTFNLPDYRGRFLRGVDGSAGVDPDKASRTAMATGGNTGNNVGSVQSDQNASHNHTLTDPGHTHSQNFYQGTIGTPSGSGYYGVGNGNSELDFAGLYSQGAQNASVNVNSTTTGITLATSGGNEARPENAYVYYIIKT